MANPLTFTLSQEEYEALIAFAREGTKDSAGQVVHESSIRLDQFLQNIEKRSGVTRSVVWVQWQELGVPLPPNTRFPEVWPPSMRVRIERVTRPISRADIDAVLDANAKNPVSVLFTKDPGALYGWTEVDQYV
jgi:hypothetical protein